MGVCQMHQVLFLVDLIEYVGVPSGEKQCPPFSHDIGSVPPFVPNAHIKICGFHDNKDAPGPITDEQKGTASR